MIAQCGVWRVETIELTEPAPPIPMASLPGAPAHHYAVTCHGYLIARPGTIGELAAVLPFPLTDLAEVTR